LSGLSKERSSLPASSVPVGLNVLKRDGSFQPFDRLKLVSSMIKAGASEQQATLVSNRVVNRLGGFKQPVPSGQLSSMVARSLGQVNPTVSNQYTSFRDQKLSRTLTAAPSPRVTAASSPIPAVIRVGPASTTAPMQVILGLASSALAAQAGAAPSGGTRVVAPDSSDRTPPPPPPPVPKIETVVLAIACDAASGAVMGRNVYLGCFEGLGVLKPSNPSQNTLPPDVCVNATLFQKGGNLLSRTGMVIYRWTYWPQPKSGYMGNSELDECAEAMENGRCDMIFRIRKPGKYEFTVYWPGDEKTQPILSNTVVIEARAPEVKFSSISI
jgi:hypothetical protein